MEEVFWINDLSVQEDVNDCEVPASNSKNQFWLYKHCKLLLQINIQEQLPCDQLENK